MLPYLNSILGDPGQSPEIKTAVIKLYAHETYLHESFTNSILECQIFSFQDYLTTQFMNPFGVSTFQLIALEQIKNKKSESRKSIFKSVKRQPSQKVDAQLPQQLQQPANQKSIDLNIQLPSSRDPPDQVDSLADSCRNQTLHSDASPTASIEMQFKSVKITATLEIQVKQGKFEATQKNLKEEEAAAFINAIRDDKASSRPSAPPSTPIHSRSSAPGNSRNRYRSHRLAAFFYKK